MRSLTTIVPVALALALGAGCKKEGATAAGVLGGPCLPSGGCDRGLTCNAGKCEKSPPAKVEPAQLQAVTAAIDKRKATDVELQKKDVVAQPVKLIDQLKSVSTIWSAALILVPDLKQYDAWVQQILLAVSEIENLRVSISSGGGKLESIHAALDNVAKGSPQTVDELQREVSGQVNELFATIDGATAKAQAQLTPVVDVMAKVEALATALCAVPLPKDATAQRDPVCKDIGAVVTAAKGYLQWVLDLPFRREIASLINSSLGPLLDEAAKQKLAGPPAAPVPAPAK